MTPSQELQAEKIVEIQGMMQNVIRNMKEIPDLPSEVPTEVRALTKVEMPDSGSVFTYMEDEDYPYSGFPFHEFVDKIDTLKKLSRGVLSSFYHSLKKRNKAQIAVLALSPWFFNDLAQASIYAFHRVIMRFKIKELRYSPAIRAVYRAMEGGNDLKEAVRDILCMVLENDNAYRFRFQDIMVEVDKAALRKNPAKELVRLLRIMQTREKNQDVADTWTLLITFLPMYLLVNPLVRKEVIACIDRLNLEKIQLAESDKWFCAQRSDYVFGFMLNPNEDDQKLIERLKIKKEVRERKQAIRQESTKAHEEMFTRHRIEQAIPDETRQTILRDSERFLVECQNEANIKYSDHREEIVVKNLTPEQYEVVQRNAEENQVLDAKYNGLLEAIDKEYVS